MRAVWNDLALNFIDLPGLPDCGVGNPYLGGCVPLGGRSKRPLARGVETTEYHYRWTSRPNASLVLLVEQILGTDQSPVRFWDEAREMVQET